MSENFLTKTITNQDIYDELLSLKAITTATHEQACNTNGRVTIIERVSIGLWIARHPFKFAGILMIFFALVISDIRHPVFDLVKNLFI